MANATMRSRGTGLFRRRTLEAISSSKKIVPIPKPASKPKTNDQRQRKLPIFTVIK